MDEKQYNALVKLISKTNDKVDGQYNTLAELIKGIKEEIKEINKRLDRTNDRLDRTNEVLNITSERLNLTNDRLKRHIEEIDRRYTNMENIIIGRNQVNEMEIKALKKENENLEKLIISVKQNSEERDDKLDCRLKAANL